MISIKNVLIATLFMSGSLLVLGGITAGNSKALFADEPNSEIDTSLSENQGNTSVETTQIETSSEQTVFD
jgi:hypothetical protein